MALRNIRLWPDPVLTTPTQPVDARAPETQALIDDLYQSMYHHDGIGLAANQVGVNAQVLVIDLDPNKDAESDDAWARELADWGFTGPVAMVNPKITARAGKMTWDEGCLSVPGVTETVTRAARVRVAYTDALGAPQKLEAAGLFAVCIQHEMDHLAGRVFVEYLPEDKLRALRKRFATRMAAAAAQKVG